MSESVIADQHTQALLDFAHVRTQVASLTATSLGRELALALEPFRDPAAATQAIRLVTEMVEELARGHVPSLGGWRDVRLMVRRAAIGTLLTADQLLEIAGALHATGVIYRYRAGLDQRHHGLIELLAPIEDLGSVARMIQGCIDGRGHVLDMASSPLAAVRKKLFDLEQKVKSEIRRLLRDPELRKILSYPNATVCGDHHVLPVAVNHRHKVAGVVHRVSGTGETVFIEPATIAALSAERMALKAEEDREIKRVLRQLTAEVARVAKPLLYGLEQIAQFDLVTAKARYSRDWNMSAPILNDEGKLRLRRARHPVVEHMCRQDPSGAKTIVPIDLHLGLGFNLLLITGPNTGGKTVCLKTAGLLAMMALSGLHIPADPGSTVPAYDHILADIGDEQSIEQSLSTFSSHMTQIARIFSIATPRSLVLLDELGAGTDPVEGAALGRAILDGLNAAGCHAIVTTHLGALKTYAFKHATAENAAVEFDLQSLQPTYRLRIGEFGQSNALVIAQRLQLPQQVLAKAAQYFRKAAKRNQRLAHAQGLKQQAETARLEDVDRQDQMRLEEDLARQANLALQRQAQDAAKLQQFRQALQTGDRVHVKRFRENGVVARVDAKRKLAIIRLGFGQWEVSLEELTPVEP